ncbi:10428_t:CDS:2, partial [Acaulospora morrowiae]
SFTPKARYAHTSVLAGDRLYFLGGYVDGGPSSELFYLDLSDSFNTESLPWVDLTNTHSIPVKSSWAAATISGDGVSICLIGGEMLDQAKSLLSNNNLVYTYNTNTQSWYAPSISGSTLTRRRQAQAVTDRSGKIYYFGGRSDNLTGNPSNDIDNNNLDILDTIMQKWNLVTTIASNGGIIIYGGINGDGHTVSLPQLAFLNTSFVPFNWTVPQTYVAVGSNVPPPLSLHSATTIGKYMIIAFGYITSGSNNKSSTNSEIYLFDITIWTWVKGFDNGRSSLPMNFGIILGITIGGGVLLICGLVFGTLYIIKSRKGSSSGSQRPPSSLPNPIGDIEGVDAYPRIGSSSNSDVEGNISRPVSRNEDPSRPASYTRNRSPSNPLFVPYSSIKLGENGEERRL